MIKIIFSDMDGTLLTSENKLPVGFDTMIAELKSRGVIFAPASGRQYFSLIDSFQRYQNEFLFLAEGGTLVIYLGKEIFSQPMDKNLAFEFLYKSDELKNILCVFCGKKNAYIRDFQDIPKYRDELLKYYTHAVAVKRWEDIDDEPIKVAFFDPESNSRESIYNHLKKYEDRAQILISSEHWVDAMMPGVNKGSAIKKIQQILDIKPEECAAFGDYLNDCEMMQAVGYSFAMANAHPDLKKFAKFETASNDEGGVLVGIKKLMDEGLI